MNYTIDASVFISAVRTTEIYHKESFDFLENIQKQNIKSFCPVIVITECASAIARQTGKIELSEKIINLIEHFPGIILVDISLIIARRASEIASFHHLRGADAIYIAVAENFRTSLITWDREMLQRTPSHIPVLSPDEWLRKNMGP